MNWHALVRVSRQGRVIPFSKPCQHRDVSTATRQRITDLWSPRAKVDVEGSSPRNATSLLIDAGYIRQAYAGVYQLLPLGLRVLTKLEALIDKHMLSVGASKVSLSAFSSQELWEASGRLANGSEMFKFKDRGGSKWLLAPTHEEEITTLLRNEIIDEKHLPVRLYQIGRKYRDEQRPRGGLLRGREFIMKDLYTFDSTPENAAETYQAIRQAYRNFFNELAVPFVEARADSGNMGGDLSHEFHFPDRSGEDTIITCDTCGHSRNEEFVPVSQRTVSDANDPRSRQSFSTARPAETGEFATGVDPVQVRDYVSMDDSTLVRVILPVDTANGLPYTSSDINTFAVKEAMSDVTEVNTGVEEYQAVQKFEEHLRRHKKDNEESRLVYLVDKRVTTDQVSTRLQHDAKQFEDLHHRRLIVQSVDGTETPINIISMRNGDPCPGCGNDLRVQKAIEIGHTFHLGTRYSSKLDLALLPKHKGGERVPVEMGCHGIGVTRLLAASVSCLSGESKEKIIWPRAIAPYDAVICVVSAKPEVVGIADQLYDSLATGPVEGGTAATGALDVALDDRAGRNYGKKITEAQLLGYTMTIMLGNFTAEKQLARLHCPPLNIEEDVPLENVVEKTKECMFRLQRSPHISAAGATE
jgi:prolyl-tRNA synthetase